MEKTATLANGVSMAQPCLRWEPQNGVIALTKSTSPERIAQSIDVFDFEPPDADAAEIEALPYCGGSGHHPDTMRF